MNIKEAKKIVSKVTKTPYEKRIKFLSKQDWDFINTLNKWFERYPGWEEITPYWAQRLKEIDKKRLVLIYTEEEK